MITYKRFWKTAKEKNVTTYSLVNTYGISAATLNRLKNDQPVSTTTLDTLCKILECNLEDIAEHVADGE